MRNKIIFFGITLFVSKFASAIEVGIGTSIDNGFSEIYLPIELNDSFRLEPTVSYEKFDQEDNSYGSEYLRLSIGLFRKNNLIENFRSYYGGRLYYLRTGYNYGNGNDSEEFDGYGIAPVMGMEYHFSDRFSLATEASLLYQKIDVQYGRENTRTSTEASVIARFFY